MLYFSTFLISIIFIYTIVKTTEWKTPYAIIPFLSSFILFLLTGDLLYFNTSLICLIPTYIILKRPEWKNPFFLIPFLGSFILLIFSRDYITFLIRFLSFTSFILMFFTYLRTHGPFIFTELWLFQTKYFTGFPEAHIFQRLMSFSFTLFLPFFGGLLAYYVGRSF